MKKLIVLLLALVAAGAVAYVVSNKRRGADDQAPARSLDTFPDVAVKDPAEAAS